MHSEPQQPDTETPTEKPPKFKNTKKSNGCLIAALIMVMILILTPLLLLGFCAVLSGNPSDQSFGLGVFAVIVISILGVVFLINELR